MCFLRTSIHRKWKFALFIFPAMLALVLGSCAANQPGSRAQNDTPAAGENLKQIHTVTVSDDGQQTVLHIAGSRDLLFSDIRKSSPPTVSFYFPGTRLVDLQNVYQVDTPPHSGHPHL